MALEQTCAVEADIEWKESCMNKSKLPGHRSLVFLGSHLARRKRTHIVTLVEKLSFQCSLAFCCDSNYGSKLAKGN